MVEWVERAAIRTFAKICDSYQEKLTLDQRNVGKKFGNFICWNNPES